VADVPPIPASCAGRPTLGGFVVPFVNVRLRDGGADFRSADNQRYELCWRKTLCQTCGNRIVGTAVFFGGPSQILSRRFDEPHVCPPCALYASRACPMVAGRMTEYAGRARIADGHRGKTCAVPGCGCSGWVETVPGRIEAGPAHPWYAVYVRAGGWVVTGEQRTLNPTPGLTVQRLVLTGGMLTAEPGRIVHVSTPGEGRVWKPMPTVPAAEPDTCRR